MLISLEGLEGCGKSTQQQLILRYLEAQGLPACGFVDPGRTRLGEAIREILLDPRSSLGDLSELFLFAVARRQLIRECIRPALAEGRVVVLDRYFDSTTAYQGYGRGINLELIEELHAAVVGEVRPNLTLIFDLAPELGLRRVAGRRRANSNSEELDRIEASGLAFLSRVREGYRAIAAAEPERCVLIPVEDGSESVFARLVPILEARLPASP